MSTQYLSLATPLGALQVLGSDADVRVITFDLPGPPAGTVDAAPGSPVHQAGEQLRAYFNGQRDVFDLALTPIGTAFQKRVWALLQTIPAGQTRGYGEIATALGQPGAARAVGLANARNPIAIVIPCHRVIGGRGALTGYAGGLDRKIWLLRREGHAIDERRQHIDPHAPREHAARARYPSGGGPSSSSNSDSRT
ncbi:MAG: cysteine methyltransferase [Xanthomonadales bacterium]|nr:cysteine methyltransferase [Xanthomonadales bacterium]|tara:strand:+ start:832 stop:1416 length:585 start_codon:yes stop_codon:yes gene_type:complete